MLVADINICIVGSIGSSSYRVWCLIYIAYIANAQKMTYDAMASCLYMYGSLIKSWDIITCMVDIICSMYWHVGCLIWLYNKLASMLDALDNCIDVGHSWTYMQPCVIPWIPVKWISTIIPEYQTYFWHSLCRCLRCSIWLDVGSTMCNIIYLRHWAWWNTNQTYASPIFNTLSTIPIDVEHGRTWVMHIYKYI